MLVGVAARGAAPLTWRAVLRGHRHCAQVRVGDVVLMARDESVPADCVLLGSSAEGGAAFVETVNLDGARPLCGCL